MVSKRIFVCLFVRICFTWLSVLCKPGNGVVVAIHVFFPVDLYFKCFNRVGWWWLIFELGWWWLIYVTWGLGAIISARPKVSPSPPLQHAQHDQDLCSTSIKHLAIEEYKNIAAAFVVTLTQVCNNSLFCTPWGHSNITCLGGNTESRIYSALGWLAIAPKKNLRVCPVSY